MFVVGKFIATKVVAIGESENTIKLKIHSITPQRADDVRASVEHLLPAPRAEGSEVTPEEKAADDAATEAWFDAFAVAMGVECIRGWTGVVSCDEEGNTTDLPVTPENVKAFMLDRRVASNALKAIGEVNAKVIADAGNV